MQKSLGTLLTLQKTLNVGPALAEEHPDVEEARLLLKGRIDDSVSRIVPATLRDLEAAHKWSAMFHGALEIYERNGLFEGSKKDKSALMSPKEVRDAAPDIGHVLEALKARPELLAKIEQGFTRVHPVPFGLSPSALKEAMGKAILRCHGEGRLRSSDGTKLKLDTTMPVWMWGDYEGADAKGSLVYFPERFDPKDHGGQTKKQILETSPFPGWLVVLAENLRRIPRRNKGKTVGGRPQIEAGRSSRDCRSLHGSEMYTLEQGFTPETWQSHFLMRIADTEGEVLDDYQDPDGAACLCTGGYFPSSGYVPNAYWDRDVGQAGVGRYVPGGAVPDDGARAEVRVL